MTHKRLQIEKAWIRTFGQFVPLRCAATAHLGLRPRLGPLTFSLDLAAGAAGCRRHERAARSQPIPRISHHIFRAFRVWRARKIGYAILAEHTHAEKWIILLRSTNSFLIPFPSKTFFQKTDFELRHTQPTTGKGRIEL